VGGLVRHDYIGASDCGVGGVGDSAT